MAEFLEPFERGRRDYREALAAARRHTDDAEVGRQLTKMAAVAAVVSAADREVTTARWVSVSFVVAAALILLGGGLLLIERAARRSGRRRKLEEEFITTLQGADDEAEAQNLLRRHVERALPGAAAIVLSRDASNRLRLPATDPAAIEGIGEPALAAVGAVLRGTSAPATSPGDGVGRSS